MIESRLADATLPEGTEVNDWVAELTEPVVRKVLAAAASSKKGRWFKSESKGHSVGQIVARHLGSIPATPLGERLNRLKAFTHPSEL